MSRLIRSDEYQIDEIDGETLLYHAGKSETLFLNETAAMVWYLCDGSRSEKDVVDLLSESYPGSEASIAEDVKEAIHGFVEFGGLQIEG